MVLPSLAALLVLHPAPGLENETRLTQLVALEGQSSQAPNPSVGQRLAGAYASVGEIVRALKAFDQSYPAQPPEEFEASEIGKCQRVDALESIVVAARGKRVVFLNEAHHVPQNRVFIQATLKRLRKEGFEVYAAETFNNPATDGLAGYPKASTGYYSEEPAFASVVRSAMRIGMTLVAYEVTERPPAGAGDEERIAFREEAQSRALQAVLKDPKVRMVVHCGFSHAFETPDYGIEWLAARLRKAIGEDVLTVDLATMREASEAKYESPVYQFVDAQKALTVPTALRRPDGTFWTGGDAAGKVDLQVFSPRTHLKDGRPDWLVRGTDRRLVALPFRSVEAKGRLLAEAFLQGEGKDGLPFDRVLVWPGQPMPKLALPKGSYRIELSEEEGRMLVASPLRVR